MPLDFPNTSTTGTVYTGTNNVIYIYDGVRWNGNGTGSLIPPINLTYDLGSTSSQWLNLYVGNAYVNGQPVGSVTTGTTAPTGGLGKLWYNPDAGRLYIYYDSYWVDASPPIGSSGGSIDLTAVSTNVLPASDLTYNLGSSTQQWRSLYVGTSTIYIGGSALSVSTSGSLTVNGSQITASFATTSGYTTSFNTSTLVNSAVYASTASGNFTVPGNLNINGGTIYNNGYALSTATSFNTSTLVSQAVSATTSSWATTASYAQSFNTSTLVSSAVSAASVANGTWTLVLSAIGQLSLPSSLTFPDSTVQTTAWTGSVSSLVNGAYTVSLSSTGTLTLPIGVSIDESNGSHFPRIVADTGKAFSVQGYGSTGSVALQWMETASTSSQIAQVGLNKFSGVAAVTLTAGTSTNDMKVWEFAADGALTFPDGTTSTGNIVVANSSSYQIKTNYFIVGNPYTATFEFDEAKLVLPGNGVIKNQGSSWQLDTNSQSFIFPNNGKLSYGIIPFISTTIDDLVVNATNTGSVYIKSGGNIWKFGNTGSLTFPDNSVQTTAWTPSNVFQDVTFSGNVTFNSSSTYVLSTNTVYTDNIIELHYTSTWAVNDGKDIGLRFHYYDTQDRNAFFGRENTTGYLEWLVNSSADNVNNVTGTNGTFRLGSIILTDITASNSTATGALQVAGGVGVGGGLYVGGTVTATTFTGLASAGTTATTSAALGYLGMPQNSTASSYTLVAGDQGKHIYVTATGQTITVPANSTTAFPVGTTIAIIAGPSATSSSIAITTDTMYLGGTGTTGTRTLAAYGMATLVKVAATTWFINGSGLT